MHTRAELRSTGTRELGADMSADCSMIHRRLVPAGLMTVALLALWLVLPVASAHAQPATSRPILLENARILTMTGDVIASGSILIRNGSIESVGTAFRSPPNAVRVDLQGRTVTPGLIDVYSALAMTGGGGSNSPAARPFDAFDRYAVPEIIDALANGVTTVHIGARAGSGVSGLTAVVRLEPLDEVSFGSVLTHDGELVLDLSSGSSSLARLSLFDRIRRQFRSAEQYRTAWETYEERLAEYIKKVEEGGVDPQPSDTPEPQAQPAPTPPAGGGGPPQRRGPRPGEVVDDPPADDAAIQQPARRPAAGGATQQQRPQQQRQGGQSQQAAQKPQEPNRDYGNDVLVKVLSGEIPVRVIAHRSADMLNALELAQEFGLSIQIEGATEAHLVAGELAAADIPVIIGSAVAPGIYRNTLNRQRELHPGDVLTEHDVRWIIGSGASGSEAVRFVLLNAQMMARNMQRPVDALELLTSRAAQMLGIADRVGTIEPGKLADLVVWSGDPLDPASRVERVYVGGRQAYEMRAAQEEE